MYQKYFKRIIDIVLSLLGIIILSPVFVVVAILVKITSKGKIFFLQERLGKDGKVFKIIKFRTMVTNAEKIGSGLRIESENDSRITKIGKILRATSLDELPQFFNIVKGDMSIIGPRPPVTHFPYNYEDYTEEKKKRFLVRPGITGLAQVRVRNNATWDERIVIDVEYVDSITFINDVKIFFGTILVVVFKKGIYKI